MYSDPIGLNIIFIRAIEYSNYAKVDRPTDRPWEVQERPRGEGGEFAEGDFQVVGW